MLSTITPRLTSSISCRRCQSAKAKALQLIASTGTTENETYSASSSSHAHKLPRRTYASSPPTVANAVSASSLATSSSSKGKGRGNVVNPTTTTTAISDNNSRSSSSSPTKTIQTQTSKTPRLRVAHELYSITGSKHRQSISNSETAKYLIKKMKLEKLPDDLNLIDIYAGLGHLSQSALELNDVRQVIGIEEFHKYTQNMENILEESAGRFAYVALDPFWWDTYRVLEEKKLLANVKKTPWEEGLPNLAMMGTIPLSINGERLVIQHLSCIAGRTWLYRFGRMPSYLLVPAPFKDRITAPAGTSKRHKTSVLLEMLVDIEELVSPNELQPFKKNFIAPHSRLKDAKYCLVKFIPKKNRLITTQDDLEALEFLAKNMFVHRGTKWGNSLKYIAPGASILTDMVKEQGHKIDPETRPQYLTSEDWLQILTAFKRWPFKPSYLDHDDIRNEAELLD